MTQKTRTTQPLTVTITVDKLLNVDDVRRYKTAPESVRKVLDAHCHHWAHNVITPPNIHQCGTKDIATTAAVHVSTVRRANKVLVDLGIITIEPITDIGVNDLTRPGPTLTGH